MHKKYCIYSKQLDRQARANSVDPDQTSKNMASDQGLHKLTQIQRVIDSSMLQNTASDQGLTNWHKISGL